MIVAKDKHWSSCAGDPAPHGKREAFQSGKTGGQAGDASRQAGNNFDRKTTAEQFRFRSECARVFRVQAHIGLRTQFSDCRREAAQLFRAEDVKQRNQEPFVIARLKCRRNGSEKRRAVLSWLDQSHARVAAPQRPRDFALEIVYAWMEFQPGDQKKGIRAAGG